MASPVKPFTFDGSQYDLNSYWGRVSHFFDMVDLRNCFVTQEELTEAQGVLKNVKEGKRHPTITDAELWNLKKKVDSAIHPDTGDTIPLLFRMSLFMPANLPITAGMLLSGTGIKQVFWQWLNQSYNAGFNYGNRNATVPIDAYSLAASYGVATGVACGMSFGLGKMVEKLQAKVGGGPASTQPFGLKLLMRGLPWMAVASAGMANAVAMRYKEAVDGITVYTPCGEAAGTSVLAGRASLSQVALTRAALPVPILLIPPFLLDAISNTKTIGKAMQRSAPIKLGVELSVFALFLQCALPFAIALFPQKGTIHVSALEEAFRNQRDSKTGLLIETYTYNKGL